MQLQLCDNSQQRQTRSGKRSAHLLARSARLLALFSYTGIEHDLSQEQHYFTVFSDSDHTKEPDCVSVSGYVSMFNGSAINWSSKKQVGTVALSSMEAEVITSCNAMKEAAWTRKFLNEFESAPWSINVGIDNQATIYFNNAVVNHTRAKHIDM